jgi:serine/threonine-protein kinase
MAAPQDICDPDRVRLLSEGRLPAEELSECQMHLEHCPQCQARLDELARQDRFLGTVRHYLAAEPGATPDGDRAPATLDFLTPSDWPDSMGRLGLYEVKGILGRGGMGIVLKAHDVALHRNVAIKVLLAPLAAHGAARRRFLREARAAAAVVHEHVVAVHAVDEARGLPYLVMEYVPGRSLQERLDRDGPLSLTEVLRIGMQTAAGLAAAHAQGLVHRDVKPANILLENGVERVRLTDFGLARAVADAALTQSGVVAGTPQYMAPEQARAEAVDHRADLFSLGSTLYAMCTGHPPFRAESAVAVLRRVSDDPPRPVRELNPDVPEWLAAIIARLHAKDPAQRYQSAAEVADLLGRCLAHVQQPLVLPLPPAVLPAAARPRVRRGRLLLGAFATALLASAAVVAVLLLLRPHGRGHDASTDDDPSPTKSTEWVLPAAGEIDQQAQVLRERTAALEADLHSTGGYERQDPLAARIWYLSMQVSALEREVTSNPGSLPGYSISPPGSADQTNPPKGDDR